eukprot:15508-Heterococcus_DN1.PRE.4
MEASAAAQSEAEQAMLVAFRKAHAEKARTLLCLWRQQVAQLSQNNINLVRALAEKDAKLTALEAARSAWETEKQQLEASVIAATAAAIDSVQAELKAELQAQRKEAIHATSALYKHAQRTVKAACKRHRPESTDGADSSSSPKKQRLDADNGEFILHVSLPKHFMALNMCTPGKAASVSLSTRYCAIINLPTSVATVTGESTVDTDITATATSTDSTTADADEAEAELLQQQSTQTEPVMHGKTTEKDDTASTAASGASAIHIDEIDYVTDHEVSSNAATTNNAYTGAGVAVSTTSYYTWHRQQYTLRTKT